MFLSEVCNIIKIIKIFNLNKNRKFKTITNSTEIADHSSILVINSTKFKKKFLTNSQKKNIPALITNKYIKEFHNTQFIVKNTNKESLKILQGLFPYKPDKSIAITGTNGKTSVAWYLSQICNQANLKTKMLGTLGFYKNHKKVKDTFLTTPAFEDLYQFSHSKNKSTYNFIFEASSHALSQNRLRNIPVDIAAITNISNDHLDYHKNMSNYTKAKFLLFKKYLNNEGFAVINYNLKNLNELKKIIKKRKIKNIIYGAKDIFFEKKNKLYLNIYKKKYLIKNLNINNIEKQNIECAISIALLLKINIGLIIKILNKLKIAPGRLQKIKLKKGKGVVIIDYAHTPDALKNVLIEYTTNKIKPSILFGCGGNRDFSKRELMALVAKKYANKVYITDDNPRNEDPKKIRKEILKYCPKGIEISDRKIAIKTAIKNMSENDILILAGKGHEKYQIFKNKRISFDDSKVAKEAIDKKKC